MKRCPFCAEEIQDAAIKCRHCGAMLTEPEKRPWYFKNGMLVVAFLMVGPLMLPLLWISPYVSRRGKLGWTLAISAFSALLTWATIRAVSILLQYYRMLEQSL